MGRNCRQGQEATERTNVPEPAEKGTKGAWHFGTDYSAGKIWSNERAFQNIKSILPFSTTDHLTHT